jgi:glutamine---fructose-6-phosphate transaminase (isomerizing)
MNMDDPRYAKFALAKEMTEVVGVLSAFDAARTASTAERIRSAGRLFLAGEGSSRIFPAKNAIRKALQWNLPLQIATDGARQALEYDLSGFAVFCASNSGRTQEVVALAKKLTAAGNQNVYGLSANSNTVLESSCRETFVLTCGWEAAVAATKSVIEQALFYETLIRQAGGRTVPPYAGLAAMVREALTMSIDRSIIEAAAAAPTIYFAGYNDGVAEELTLKTNEITRKKSDYLEGTYAVHGIEEVMDKNDIVFVVDPIEEEVSKFHDVLVKGVGLKVIAIADRPTPFPTIRIPAAGELKQYVQLCAGWNLLLETGLLLGIDLDKPQRARKVGNEYTPPAV